MMHDMQARPSTQTDRAVGEPCTGCGTDVRADPAIAGLHCARCGQWQALCGDCMPTVTEYTRDAVWRCPECLERPLDS